MTIIYIAVIVVVILIALSTRSAKRSTKTISTIKDISDEGILAQVKLGNKIEAIKLYRELHNVGLRESKEAIDAMEIELGLRD